MKKLLTKILFIAVLCSTGVSNVVQANLVANLGKLDKSVLDLGESVLDLGESVLNLGKPILNLGKPVWARLRELKKYSAVEFSLSYKECAVGLVVAGVAAGAVFVKSDRFWQSQSKDSYPQRYNDLYNIIFSKCKIQAVNEDTAQNIFESGEVRAHKPKWCLSWKKVEFIEGFVKYCEEKREEFNVSTGDGIKIVDGKFRNEIMPNRDNAQKVLDMTTTHLGYLQKPWVTKKDLIYVAVGIALSVDWGNATYFNMSLL